MTDDSPADVSPTLLNMFANDTATREMAVRTQIVDAYEHIDECLNTVTVELDNLVRVGGGSVNGSNMISRVQAAIQHGVRVRESVPPAHMRTFQAHDDLRSLDDRIRSLQRFLQQHLQPILREECAAHDDSGLSSGVDDACDDSDGTLFSDGEPGAASRAYDDAATKSHGIRVLSDDE